VKVCGTSGGEGFKSLISGPRDECMTINMHSLSRSATEP
jgi:hypothetical protein